MLRLNLRIPLRDLGKCSVPEIPAVAQRIALVGHGQFSQPALSGKGEGKFKDSFHSLPGSYTLLNRNFIGRAFLEETADADIKILCVLAKHCEVNVVLGSILERRQAPVEQFDR